MVLFTLTGLSSLTNGAGIHVMTFQTAAPSHLWLNDVVAVGEGTIDVEHAQLAMRYYECGVEPAPRLPGSDPMTSTDFHKLHRTEFPFLLPNAWDAASAMAFVDAGFPAVGTTSFGVASGLGLPDGDRTTRDANLALARALSGCWPVPVSLDIEDGYHDDAQAVADHVAALDVAGINLEDSTAETPRVSRPARGEGGGRQVSVSGRLRQRAGGHLLAGSGRRAGAEGAGPGQGGTSTPGRTVSSCPARPIPRCCASWQCAPAYR